MNLKKTIGTKKKSGGNFPHPSEKEIAKEKKAFRLRKQLEEEQQKEMKEYVKQV